METQFFLSLISGLFIAGVAGYLGTLMLTKRMSVVAGPLAHLAFPGVALAIVYDFSFALGVFPFVILGALFIWYVERKTKLPMENLSAVIFAIGVGTSLLFLPIGKAQAALVGVIMEITVWESIMVIILSILAFLTIQKIYNSMLLINIYEDLAIANKINVSQMNLIYLLVISVIVALGVYLVGGLITAALISIPAGTARNFSRSFSTYKFMAILIGMFGTSIGVILSKFFGMPSGPMIVVIQAVFFILSVFYKQFARTS